jgi:hypothetical protein
MAGAIALARAFRTMVHQQQAGQLDEWLLATDGTAMAGFASGLKRDLAAVRAALSLPWFSAVFDLDEALAFINNETAFGPAHNRINVPKMRNVESVKSSEMNVVSMRAGLIALAMMLSSVGLRAAAHRQRASSPAKWPRPLSAIQCNRSQQC